MTNTEPGATRDERGFFIRAIAIALKAVLPVLFLAAGAGMVYGMMKTAPQPHKAAHTRRARLVTVVEARRAPHRIQVQAQGAVRPARETTLNPQVSGEVLEISDDLEPGGQFRAGERILRIEPTDYELTAKMRQAELTRMESQRVLVKANQDVAKREYEVLGESLADEEKSLVLREPQLTSASAEVSAARAMLDDANLDLRRTEVIAPFDAQVVEKYVDLGTRLTSQTPIVKLVGTDTYWVELNVAESDLRWVQFPGPARAGSAVILRQPKVWGPDGYREGHVIRLIPELTAEVRMARVLVAVDDPLCLDPANEGKPKLLVNQYLTAEIEGATLDDIVALDWSLLRNGDWVWIMNADNELDIRAIDIAYRGLQEVLVRDGIAEGERIVSTDIAAASQGMGLRLEGDEDAPAPEKPSPASGKGAPS